MFCAPFNIAPLQCFLIESLYPLSLSIQLRHLLALNNTAESRREKNKKNGVTVEMASFRCAAAEAIVASTFFPSLVVCGRELLT